MPVPQRRQSKSRSGTRRSHAALSAVASTICKNCAEPVLAHHVCRACGFYKGEQILGLNKAAAVEEEVAAE